MTSGIPNRTTFAFASAATSPHLLKNTSFATQLRWLGAKRTRIADQPRSLRLVGHGGAIFRCSADSPNKATNEIVRWNTWNGSAQGSNLRALQRAARDALKDAARAPYLAQLALFFVDGIRSEEVLHRASNVVAAELAMARMSDTSTILIGSTVEPFQVSSSIDSQDDCINVGIVTARLPGVVVYPFRIGQQDTKFNLDWRQENWLKAVGCDATPTPSQCQHESPTEPGAAAAENGANSGVGKFQGPDFLLFQHSDFPIDDFLAGLDFAYPSSAKVGCKCGNPRFAFSGGVYAADGQFCVDGVVGVAFQKQSTDVDFKVIVAQGARPIGTRLEVLEVRENREILKVKELTGTGVTVETAPLQILDMWTHMNIIDKEDSQHAVRYVGVDVETVPEKLVGYVPDTATGSTGQVRAPSYSDAQGQPANKDVPFDDASAEKSDNSADQPPDGNSRAVPDVLVRRVIGTDSSAGSITVDGPPVRLGTGLRFQVRDGASVVAEMEKLQKVVPPGAVGGIVFTDYDRVRLMSSVDGYVQDDVAFGRQLARLVGSGEVGPLPAPGYQEHFPIQHRFSAASTFEHSSTAVFFLVYGKQASQDS